MYFKPSRLYNKYFLYRLIKFLFKLTEKTIILACWIVFFIGLGFYNLIKFIYNLYFYRKHGFTYLELYKKINHMTGRDFEIFMYNLFKANGIETDLTQQSADGGKDLISIINNQKTYIELKRWSKSWRVDRPTVQKLIGACIGDNIHKAIFITTGEYTNEAMEYADKIPFLELWNMEDIMDMCSNVKDEMPMILSKCNIINSKTVYHSLKKTNRRLYNYNKKLEHRLKYDN
jgi:restriction system protein